MRLTLKTKITAAVFAVLVMGLLSTVVALLSAYRTNRILQTVVAQSLESVRAAEELEIALLEQRGFVSAYLLAEGQGDWLNQLQSKYETFDSWFQIAGAAAHTDRQQDTLRQLARVYRDYLRKRERVVELYRAQSADEAKRMLLQDVQAVYEQAYALCEDFIAAVDRDVVAATTRAAVESRRVTWGVAACVALTLVSAILLLVLFYRGVLQPLSRMAADANEVSGALVDEGRSQDELRAVGTYLQSLMSDVVETRQHLETSQRRLLQAEKLASVGKLASCVAHEIRNPLTAIKMWQFSIRKAVGGNPELDHKFDVVAEELARLERIVQNFLEFSRPPELALRSQQVSSLIGKTLELFRHRCDTQAIKITLHEPPNLPDVCVDSDQVKQVLLNLLQNSADAMPVGGTIRITLSLTSDGGKQRVLLRVRDTGHGMAEDVAARIFEPFFTTKDTGNGLGLCVTASVMERLGGRIILESTSPDGTTFALWLPVGDG